MDGRLRLREGSFLFFSPDLFLADVRGQARQPVLGGRHTAFCRYNEWGYSLEYTRAKRTWLTQFLTRATSLAWPKEKRFVPLFCCFFFPPETGPPHGVQALIDCNDPNSWRLTSKTVRVIEQSCGQKGPGGKKQGNNLANKII